MKIKYLSLFLLLPILLITGCMSRQTKMIKGLQIDQEKIKKDISKIKSEQDYLYETTIETSFVVSGVSKRVEKIVRDQYKSQKDSEDTYDYIVKSWEIDKECLTKIAVELMGSYRKWKDIYEVNKDVIKDPDLIYKGQVIRIPK